MDNIDLKSIIDQVRRYATSNIGGRGQTAAQGRAMLGLGELVGGMEQSQNKLASAEKLGMMGMQNEIEQQKIASSPGMMQAETERLTVPGSGGLFPKDKQKITTSPSWWSEPTFGKLFDFD